MLEILARPSTRRETCVKPRHKTPICQPLAQPERTAPVGVEVRISANHYLRSGLPGRPDRLPRALIIPAIHEDSVVSLIPNDFPDLRRIETCEPAVPRRLSDILQEGVWVTCQEIDVPIKLDPETRPRLILRGRVMAKKYVKIDFRMRRQSAKPGSVVLNGMRAQDP